MKTWEDMFDIHRFEVESKKKRFWHPDNNTEWRLIRKADVVIIGTYKDYNYAVKQARYRFRKAIKQVERTLLL